jgi:transposase
VSLKQAPCARSARSSAETRALIDCPVGLVASQAPFSDATTPGGTAVTGEIDELSQVEAKCRRLRSVPGIGPLISTAVVAAIGAGEAFERGRDFAAWLGLVPRQHSTGGRSILGRISKRGSKYLRTLMIQAAKVLLMRPHNWARYARKATV